MPRESDELEAEELDHEADEEGANKSAEHADEGDDDAGDDGGDDDGGEEDHGDDDAAGADEGHAGKADQVRGRGGRASDTIRTLKAERRADRERLQRLEQELDGVKRGGQQQQQPRETPAQRAERWSLMSPAEIAAETASELRNEFQQQLFAQQFQSNDRADRADFRSACKDNPALGRVADQVESMLAEQRRNGINTPRETIAYYLLGKRAVERAGSAGTRQRKRADVDKERNRGKPGAGVRGRSDADRQRSGGDDRAARRARLENVTF